VTEGGLSLINCIVWDNSSDVRMDVAEDTDVQVEYSCIENEREWPGPGNITDNPQFCGWSSREIFVDPEANPGGDGTPASPYQALASALTERPFDLGLAPDSPCRGTGKDGVDMGSGHLHRQYSHFVRGRDGLTLPRVPQ
jgi:hypothetical protein